MKKLLALLLCVLAFSANAQDNTFFGITLGEPLSYPPCDVTASRIAEDEICMLESENGALVFYSSSVRPLHTDGLISTSTIDGNVEQISVLLSQSNHYLELLENRFGPPAKSLQGQKVEIVTWELANGVKITLIYFGDKTGSLDINSKKYIDFLEAREAARVQF